MKDIKNTLILSGTAIVLVLFAGWIYFNRAKADDIVNVTGLGRVDFEADLISWNSFFRQSDVTLENAYAKLKKSHDIVKAYLAEKAVKAEEVTFYSVNIDKNYESRYNSEGKYTGDAFIGYTLTQSIKIESRDVDKIESLSRSVTELIDQGVEFYSLPPDYFYTKLPDLKMNLLAQATQDARNRAVIIAKNAGGGLGKLRYSNMGVFQILEANSSEEISWQGTFNTKARKKTATLTVRVQYQLK